MVVGEVPVLVVRRIEVREVECFGGLRDLARVGPERDPFAGDELRDAERQRLKRPRCPLLDVRHLHAGRRVDAVGRLEEAREQYGIQPRIAIVALDRVADRVDAPAVVRLEEPRSNAEGLRGVAVDVGPGGKVRECLGDLVAVGGVSVERHVALGEHLGVPRRVDRGDVRTPALELLGDARRAGEQVERPARSCVGANGAQHGYQPSFRSQVLDQTG